MSEETEEQESSVPLTPLEPAIPNTVPTTQVQAAQSRITRTYKGISHDIARRKLGMWLEAEDAVALGQSYTINGRSLTRANLAQIREQIEYWGGIVERLEDDAVNSAGIRLQRAIPTDY